MPIKCLQWCCVFTPGLEAEVMSLDNNTSQEARRDVGPTLNVI